MFSERQNIVGWLLTVEHFDKLPAIEPFTIPSMGKLFLMLPYSLQLAILHKLDIKDFAALRLVNKSFKELIRKCFTTLHSRGLRYCKVTEDREFDALSESWQLLTIESVDTLFHIDPTTRKRDRDEKTIVPCKLRKD